MNSPTMADRLRQITVTVAEMFCLVGTLVGTGAIGTRVEESSGGALAADATRLAPAGPAFSIWSVIYLGLLAYAIYQWLPSQTTRARHRAIGWLVALSMVLNAAWLLVTQQGWIAVSVAVIFALAITLGLLLRRASQHDAGSLGDKAIIDGTFGLYLGWVAVATAANVTAALVSGGVEFGAIVSDILAALVIAGAGGLGIWFSKALGARLAVAAAMAWGLGWIVVGRLTDEPESVLTAVAALLAAVAILAVTIRRRISA